MPGMDWDLNLDPDQQASARRLSFSDADSAEPLRESRSLQRGRRSSSRYDHAAPRQSFLPSIEEGASEGQEAETSVTSSQFAAPRSAPVTSFAALYPGQGGMPHLTSAPPSAPVTSSAALYPAQGGMQHPTSAPPSAPVTSSATLYQVQSGMPRPTSAPVSTSLVLAAPAPLQSQQLQETVAAATTLEYQRQFQAAMQQQAGAAAEAAALSRLRVRLLRLYTVAGRPAGYETKWSELHPLSRRLLLRIEEKLGEFKYQSEQLDQCSCLHDPSLYNKSFELNASHIMQEVGSTSTIMDRERVSIKGLTDVVKKMARNVDIALHSYVKLRPKFVQGGAAGYTNRLGPSGGYTELNQHLRKAPTFCCYSAPRRPSPFIQLTIARFEEQIGECFKWVEELEQLVHTRNDKSFPESLESLSKVLSNLHYFFIHVASKVEDIHQTVEAMKTQYLYDRRCRGDWNNPFVEADKRESAKHEATSRIVHPTLDLSPPCQPTTPVTASVMASQLQQNSFPMVQTFPSAGPTLPPPLLLPVRSTAPSPAPITNPFSSSSITSSIPPLFATLHGGGTTVQASTGLSSNKTGRPPSRR